MKLTYFTEENIKAGEAVSIDEYGHICRWLEGITLPAFAFARRDIRKYETITFSNDPDSDLIQHLNVGK